jgi:hypothetical protein
MQAVQIGKPARLIPRPVRPTRKDDFSLRDAVSPERVTTRFTTPATLGPVKSGEGGL